MKTHDYTIRFMKRSKPTDECVAEIVVTGVTASHAEMVAHYTKFGRMFMQHIKFDYVTAR
jgi:hypothetical protein